MGFSLAQEEAIHHGKGPAMVLAGPGSGKTMVITHRVKYLVEEYGIDPSSILVITFTKAAADEMKSRFQRLMEGKYLPVTFGTFHAVFFKILKHAYSFSAANIIRPEQKYNFLKEILEDSNLDMEDEKDMIQKLESEISAVKGDRLSLECYYSQSCPEEIFREIYRDYELRLHRAGLIDFDDMMKLCYELFSERPDILSAWQKKYAYILIDEFQDINRIQYEIVRMLARPGNHLFIVGDDDQSIYRFRGAKPEIMLGFPRDYPSCHQILLDINYRSVPAVVEASSRLIAQNSSRFPKKIRACRTGQELVTVFSYSNLLEENDQVIRKLQNYQRQGIPYEEMALLYRTNIHPRVMAEQLMRCHIPFQMGEVAPNLYEHWISRDILTYMLIAAGSRSRGDFLHIINRPKRYISRNAFPDPQVSLEKLKETVKDKDWVLERVERLEYDLNMISRMRPWAAVNYIRKAVGYDDFIREYAQQKKMQEDEWMEVLDELHESAKPFSSLDEWLEYIREYSRNLQEKKKEEKQDRKGVSIMTMHSSKGLEYQVVFIMDANEGITPHKKAVLQSDMEEERRLFYVAMTRAKKYLHICYSRERFNREMPMSRFVQELGIPPETDKHEEGTAGKKAKQRRIE
ncbi:MAG: ATP-dependent helicase [Clostridiales bacterium]|nr:ATP-dependent helicase [Clostridiales bacterium]